MTDQPKASPIRVPGSVGFSIRLKLFLLLLCLPTALLASYLALATRLFEADKTAYVFDSSAAVSESLAARVSAELLAIQMGMRAFLERADLARGEFDAVSRDRIESDGRILGIFLMAPEAGLTPHPLAELTSQRQVSPEELVRARASALELARSIVPGYPGRIHLLPIEDPAHLRNLCLVGSAFALPGGKGEIRAVALFLNNGLAQRLDESGAYQKFLVDDGGRILYGPVAGAQGLGAALPELLSRHLDSGSAMLPALDGKSFLTSYSRVGGADLYVVSAVSREVSFRAVQTLLAKSVLLFLLMVGCTLILSLLASRRLTAALAGLHRATAEVAQGNFEIQVAVISRDEVGDLARSFNRMAARISALIRENIEKARMEAELETARLVQKTLLPDPRSSLGPLEVASLYLPATECGGDWWHFSELQGKYFLWIGDVTGHGVPAALMTAAASATTETIESFGPALGPQASTGMLLALMNRSIYRTGKGRLQMTCFCACLDPTSGDLTYSNASHPPPYWIDRGSEGGPGELRPLSRAKGPILGMSPDAEFPECSIPLRPSDSLIVYTDGVFEAFDRDGKRLRIRSLEEIISRASAGGPSAAEILRRIQESLSNFQQKTARADDLTVSVYSFSRAISPGS